MKAGSTGMWSGTGGRTIGGLARPFSDGFRAAFVAPDGRRGSGKARTGVESHGAIQQSHQAG